MAKQGQPETKAGKTAKKSVVIATIALVIALLAGGSWLLVSKPWEKQAAPVDALASGAVIEQLSETLNEMLPWLPRRLPKLSMTWQRTVPNVKINLPQAGECLLAFGLPVFMLIIGVFLLLGKNIGQRRVAPVPVLV